MADWNRISSRGDVEDRRSNRPVAIGGIGLTGIALILAFNFLTGGSVGDALNTLEQFTPPVQTSASPSGEFAGKDSYEVFASTVLGSTNDLWTFQFNRLNKTYLKPKLVLFRQSTESGCGGASSEVGPHYCPEDKTIYLDETFFDELTNRFGAKGGDVAQAYVLAHEAGHHAQEELGLLNTSDSIKTELQADCFAGLWANSIKDQGVLEPGEISEAMDAAAAVGDDRIQKKVTGYLNPETWTHGSSAQRLAAFTKGYDQGTLAACQ